MSHSAITFTDKVENGGTTVDGLVGSSDLNEIKSVSNSNASGFDVRLDSLELTSATSTVVVKQASDLSGTLLSTVVYFIDGIIDMGSQSIEVPAGGLSLIGSTFNACQLTSSAVGYTMFTSPVGGSGDLLGKDLAFETSGATSQVFNLVSATGFDAFEFARVNFNNCTSLGTVDNYRQGLEDGSGRFGGTPSLVLKGAWAGGYRITTSIVRSLDAGMTTALFARGAGLSMASRFLTDINCDLPALAPLMDFFPVDFPNPSTLQIQGAIVTRDGVSDATDTNITPNVNETDLCSAWRDNNGLKNTFVGGVNVLAIEAETVISTINIPVGINGTWVPYGLVHFDSPSAGRLRHLGNDPTEFRVPFDFVLEGADGDQYEIRLIKDDGAETLVYSQTRVINNLQGGRNVAYFDATTYVELNQGDSVFWQVLNKSSTANCTLEDSSQFNVEAR